jgi:hypothetical protein
MAYFSKRVVEEEEKFDTPVWSCESEQCLGWMRKNFSFQLVPQCPLCASAMREESRMLPFVEA